MRKIVVAEATSTGANYIADIIKRGYEPVILEPWIDRDSEFYEIQLRAGAAARKNYPCDPVTIEATDDYEETLATVRALDPVLVIPDTESGVELATRLSEDLGLPGNPCKNMDAYLKKARCTPL